MARKTAGFFLFQKLLEIPMASFRIKLKFLWNKKTGKVRSVGGKKSEVAVEENQDAVMETAQ
jgi:hypothetical protein